MQKMFVANKALIINQEGKILLVRDSGVEKDHQAGAGSWDIPGGRMDKADKTINDALARELQEELGVELDVLNKQIITASLWSIGGDDDRRVMAVIYIIKVNFEIPVILSAEHTEFGWFNPAVVDQETASPCLRQVLEVYQEKKDLYA
ncbi:NUDIX hydrolase [Candidatus Uhrbacteria bacterium]|jgi:8-oxo-dGTP pyrophosphatase MutT (NUDIX family)|nr:NUDIX hydrolase [Candidatus Uhrbacteria bacterium]MBT7717677.1 NUDIX hydrolase [Candidatus Uhrbacteria bacterium]